MRITGALFVLSLAVAYAAANPVVKRETEPADLSPLNEVYVVENVDEQGADDDRADRDKRKIGVLKLGVSNGIINFVFSKLDSFIDSKTRALGALDEANKAKNAAFGIDNKASATSKFISEVIASKIQAASGSIGPVINSAQTLISGAKSGLVGAFASKLAPLSSISGGLLGGSAGVKGDAGAGGLNIAASLGGPGTAGILANILSTGVSSLSAASKTGGGAAPETDASAGLNVGAYANVGPGEKISTSTEDIPEFDRTKVSLDVPGAAFGTGFNIVTNVSKILSSLILNSARRTQTVLEVFKPFFRGVFAIKGLPSDNPNP